MGSNVLKIFCPCPERQEQKYQRVYYKSSPKTGEHKELTIGSGQSFVAMFVYYIPLFTGYQSLYKHGLKDGFCQRDFSFLLLHFFLLLENGQRVYVPLAEWILMFTP